MRGVDKAVPGARLKFQLIAPRRPHPRLAFVPRLHRRRLRQAPEQSLARHDPSLATAPQPSESPPRSIRNHNPAKDSQALRSEASRSMRPAVAARGVSQDGLLRRYLRVLDQRRVAFKLAA